MIIFFYKLLKCFGGIGFQWRDRNFLGFINNFLCVLNIIKGQNFHFGLELTLYRWKFCPPNQILETTTSWTLMKSNTFYLVCLVAKHHWHQIWCDTFDLRAAFDEQIYFYFGSVPPRKLASNTWTTFEIFWSLWTVYVNKKASNILH